MNRELLESKFSPEQIKQRSGKQGKTLDYIEGHSIIQRLNDVFDGNWSFEIVSHEILEEEVIVKGRLSADEVIKNQFGSSAITRAKETGAIVNLADDLKSAATDSLKKCATMLGVGLYLYSGQPDSTEGKDSGQPAGEGKRPANTKPQSGAQSKASSTTTNDNARVSNKQLTYLLDLGKETGLDSKSLDKQ